MPKTRFRRDKHAGKTTTAQQVADASDLTAINIGELVSSQSLHDGYDNEFESWVINDDKVKDIHPLLSSAQSLEAGAWSDRFLWSHVLSISYWPRSEHRQAGTWGT